MRLKFRFANKYVCVFLIYFVIFSIMYAPLYLQNLLPLSGDGLGFYYTRDLIRQWIQGNGEFPLWNKYLLTGAPFAGDLNGVFSPILLFCMLFPLKISVYLYYILHVVIGAFFTYLFLREIKCQQNVAFCFGIVYLFTICVGGYRKSHIMLIAVITFLPAVLYFIQRFINEGKKQYMYLSAICMAFSFYEGFPQVQLYLDVTVFFVFLFLMIKKSQTIKKIIVTLLQWIFLFFALISIQLFPLVEEMLFYSDRGASNMSWEAFQQYSIHPIKILMVLFPQAFGNIISSMGISNSSEMDIEVFMGATIVLLILFGAIKYYMDARVQIGLGMIIGGFLYASCAHIPILGRLIYHLPIFGSMRCPSRAIFIFIFGGLVVSAVTLSKIIEKNEWLLWVKVLKRIGLFLILLLFMIVPMFFALTNDDVGKYNIWNAVKINYFPVLFIVLLLVLLVLLLDKALTKYPMKRKIIYNMGVVSVCVLSIIQLFPYSIMTSSSRAEDYRNEENELYINKMKEELENGKVWLASSQIDGAYESIVMLNSNMIYQLPVLNAYISLNNPALYKLLSPNGSIGPQLNFSGLYTGYENARDNILLDNDILSMLGIKYIIDPQHYVSEDGEIVTNIKNTENVLLSEGEIQISNLDGNVYVSSFPIDIEANTFYKLTFKAFSQSQEVEFYVDFFGGEDYDNPEQQVNISVNEKEKQYEFMIYSGDTKGINDIELRFVVDERCDLNLEVVILVEQQVSTEKAYVPFIIDDNQRIYENINAKDILYTPQEVINIENTQQIYDNVNAYDFVNISYVENLESFEAAKADINEIKWKSNSIEAMVTVGEGETFVNFSQSFYPGWRAYVDGEETNIYMVNGIIQGIVVGEGMHTIKFVFEPYSLYIGAIVTLASFALIICSVIYRKRKE